jgi:hypothetical protein
MDNPSIDLLTRRLEVLERENHRWMCVACVTALGLALSLALGGLLGSRVVAQQPDEKAGNRAARPMEYKVSGPMYLSSMEKPLRDMAAEGWEVVQVVPVEWTTSGQGQAGHFDKGLVVTRRQMVPGR